MSSRAARARQAELPARAADAQVEQQPVFVWERSGEPLGEQLREIWEYRELLYFLVWRDVKVRYKQTGLGVLWVVLQPVLMMAAFSLFFGRLAGMPADGIPYPLFVFAGLVPWQMFATALSSSGNSLVMNGALITEVYFPRIFIPLASVLVGLVDLVIMLVVMLALLLGFGVAPSARLLALPAFVALAVGTAFAMGLWLSALCVRYRDVQFAIPFLAQFWLFVTPVAYPSSLVPETWRTVYALNPMVGVVDGFRWALLGHELQLDRTAAVSVAVTVVLLAGGIARFKRLERTFADVV
jgi:lipopolysaccharide transport system permease protein